MNSRDDSTASASPWWLSFFDDDYAAYGLANDPPEIIERAVGLILRTLKLQPGQLLFDQCCGIGRLSVPLAERGIRVIGVDQADSYVQAARSRAAARDLACEFHLGDAFDFVAPTPCDAAINWFTSFGYSPDDRQNTAMLRRAFESLKPGGGLLIDYMNVPGVMANFRPALVERPAVPALRDVLVVHETKPDFVHGMMNLTMTFIYPDGRRSERRVSTRAFMPHEIAGLLRQAGFEHVELIGSAEGEPYDRTSRRCIVHALKPAG